MVNAGLSVLCRCIFSSWLVISIFVYYQMSVTLLSYEQRGRAYWCREVYSSNNCRQCMHVCAGSVAVKWSRMLNT